MTQKRPGLMARSATVAAAMVAAKEPPAPATVAATAPKKGDIIGLTVRLDPAIHDELRRIAFDERVSLHSLLLEGIDLLLKNRRGI